MRRGEQLGSLHGIPLSIKSSIEVEGLRSEAGSRLRAGCRTSKHAPLVGRLKDAGAIILGTTNCPGWSPEGLPIDVQITARPWQEEVVLAITEVVERVCGGWKPPPI